jgi:hypothetical protein
MKHPCLILNTQGHDYSEQFLKVQILKIEDVPFDH